MFVDQVRKERWRLLMLLLASSLSCAALYCKLSKGTWIAVDSIYSSTSSGTSASISNLPHMANLLPTKTPNDQRENLENVHLLEITTSKMEIAPPNADGKRTTKIAENGVKRMRLNAAEEATVPGDFAKSERIISRHFIGRLGNNMFQYAAVLGLSLQFNRTFVCDSTKFRGGFKQLSHLPLSVIKDVDPNGTGTKEVNAPAWGKCDQEFIGNISANPRIPHISVSGDTQAWCYFNKYRDRIRLEFTFNDDIVSLRNKYLTEKAREAFGKDINTEMITYIGVHIRRGDMTLRSKRTFGYKLANDMYLQNAVQYMENHTDSAKHRLYIVASDDSEWSRTYFKAPSPTSFLYGHFNDSLSDMKDMAVLTGCNHTIMTVGSYSWWAAYLAGGVAVYYKNFPLNGSRLSNGYDMHDYYLPEWVGIE